MIITYHIGKRPPAKLPTDVAYGSFSTDPTGFACRSMSVSPRKRTCGRAEARPNHIEIGDSRAIQAPEPGLEFMRYELTDYEWAAIKPFLPNKPRGVPRVNDRRVLNGIFWVLRSGAPWRYLPDNFGPYTTCYNRFVRWRRAGVWDRIMNSLSHAHDAGVQMIDTRPYRLDRTGPGDVADLVHGSAEGRAVGAMEERAKCCDHLAGAGKEEQDRR